ncbi:hypothetical protein D3C78_1687550 [compost metagenome]
MAQPIDADVGRQRQRAVAGRELDFGGEVLIEMAGAGELQACMREKGDLRFFQLWRADSESTRLAATRGNPADYLFGYKADRSWQQVGDRDIPHFASL